MTTLKDIDNLLERVRRLQARLVVTAGPGAEWKVDVPGFGVHSYRVTGIKSPVELEDDFAALSIWIWSLKDYIKEVLLSLGRDAREVERLVDSDHDLQVCADIANSAKHSTLKQSRTGRFLQAGRLSYSIPQTALSKLTFGKDRVQIETSNPEQVTIDLPVVDSAGNRVGDAIVHFRNGVDAFEKFVRDL